MPGGAWAATPSNTARRTSANPRAHEATGVGPPPAPSRTAAVPGGNAHASPRAPDAGYTPHTNGSRCARSFATSAGSNATAGSSHSSSAYPAARASAAMRSRNPGGAAAGRTRRTGWPRRPSSASAASNPRSTTRPDGTSATHAAGSAAGRGAGGGRSSAGGGCRSTRSTRASGTRTRGNPVGRSATWS